MCSFAFPTYAASDGTEDIIASDLDLQVYATYTDSDDKDITADCKFSIWNSDVYPEYKGFACIRVPFPSILNSSAHVVLLSDSLKLTADHEYELDFDFGCMAAGSGNVFSCNIVYYDSSGEAIKTDFLYSHTITDDDPVSVNFSFKPNVSDIKGGYSARLFFEFIRIVDVEQDWTGNSLFLISDEIGFVDKDDDSGWFQKIINKIEETISNIKEIPQKINQKLTELKESITNAFVELKDNLIEGLKGLFVPSDGFFEEKKAELELFLEDHFGILWTAPNIMISTIEQLLTMSPKEPSITMPAIQFTWEDELITLTEPMTVNFNDYIGDGTPLEAFYNFYRVFVTIILIFLFINYCLKKYHYIFGKDGEAVEH